MFRKLLRAAGIAYVAYLAITVLVILPALNILPAWFVKDQYNRQLKTELVLFNPFTLKLEARGAELPELDGSPFADLDRALVNLSLESIWQPGLVFDAVQVEGLHVHLRQLPDASFNFSDLLPADSEEPAEDTEGGLPGVTVHDFRFHARKIRLTNENREHPFSTHYEHLDIEVKELSTVIEEGKPYRIDATGETGGSFHWEGTLSVPGMHSEGQLALTGISLHTVWRFLEPWVQFELIDGALDLEGNYDISWREELSYQVTEGVLDIRDIDIDPKVPANLPDTGLGWSDFNVSGIAVDGSHQQVSVESINLKGLAVEGWSEGSRVSLADLFAFDAGEENPAAENPEESEGGAPWTADVKTIQLGDSSLDWRSEFTDPPHLTVMPIEVRVENLQWPLEGNTGLSIQIAVNEQARAAIEGVLELAEGRGDIDYKLEGLPLAWFNPNFPAELKAEITGGTAEVSGRVSLDEFAPTHLSTAGAVNDFSGSNQGAEDSLTKWEQVRWDELVVDLVDREVSMAQLSINSFSGRLHIREDGSVNTMSVWQEQVGEEAEELAEDLSQGDPWKIEIPSILITQSQIDFMDESLPIPFRTLIGQLEGEVLGISTKQGAVTQVDITGSVDGYAPVALKGTAEPLSAPPALDLKLTFDGIDMALLSPYSGTYAGYAIERGLLNVRLEYSLQEGQLKGDNAIVIDQLKLGEKIESDRAVDLPLELALALLTDANGIIDLAIPISGDVDDPSFDIGGTITSALINLITKAATAPFALLANMVSSEEDLQRVNFNTGSAELHDAGKVKLDQLSTALAQRTGLTLVIMGRMLPDADTERLRDQILAAEMMDAGLSREQLQSRGPDWEKAVRKRYAALPGASGDATVGQQYKALREGIQVPVSALETLIEDRAVAVKTYLVNETGLEADRSVIEKVANDDAAHMFSGVELGVET